MVVNGRPKKKQTPNWETIVILPIWDRVRIRLGLRDYWIFFWGGGGYFVKMDSTVFNKPVLDTHKHHFTGTLVHITNRIKTKHSLIINCRPVLYACQCRIKGMGGVLEVLQHPGPSLFWGRHLVEAENWQQFPMSEILIISEILFSSGLNICTRMSFTASMSLKLTEDTWSTGLGSVTAGWSQKKRRKAVSVSLLAGYRPVRAPPHFGTASGCDHWPRKL